MGVGVAQAGVSPFRVLTGQVAVVEVGGSVADLGNKVLDRVRGQKGQSPGMMRQPRSATSSGSWHMPEAMESRILSPGTAT